MSVFYLLLTVITTHQAHTKFEVKVTLMTLTTLLTLVSLDAGSEITYYYRRYKGARGDVVVKALR